MSDRAEADAKTQALRFLSRRAHSRAQLEQKLARRYSTDVIQQVLDDLSGAGILDDAAFALERAQYGRERKKWGSHRIRADLLALGINGKIVDSVLHEIDRDGSEQQALNTVIHSWTDRRGRPATAVQIKKLFDHCLRRGFSSHQVHAALESFWPGVKWE